MTPESLGKPPSTSHRRVGAPVVRRRGSGLGGPFPRPGRSRRPPRLPGLSLRLLPPTAVRGCLTRHFPPLAALPPPGAAVAAASPWVGPVGESVRSAPAEVSTSAELDGDGAGGVTPSGPSPSEWSFVPSSSSSVPPASALTAPVRSFASSTSRSSSRVRSRARTGELPASICSSRARRDSCIRLDADSSRRRRCHRMRWMFFLTELFVASRRLLALSLINI